MPAQITFRISPHISRARLSWRNTASSMLLALPLLAIATDTSALQTQHRWSMALGTIYILFALVAPLRRFVWVEPAVVLFYPAPSTVLLATFFVFLRLWKETRLVRGADERSRTGMLTSLGFRLKKTLPHDSSWLFVAAIAAWVAELCIKLWGFGGFTWFAFWLFATAMVSVLMSRPNFEDK